MLGCTQSGFRVCWDDKQTEPACTSTAESRAQHTQDPLGAGEPTSDPDSLA